MYGVILVEWRVFLELPKQHQHRRGATKDIAICPQIRLPSRSEARQPLVEELAVNADIAHGSGGGGDGAGGEVAS
jgi:hypothetical protein